jgi:peptidoglycan/LPS O-acetylase OafA/YrhL
VECSSTISQTALRPGEKYRLVASERYSNRLRSIDGLRGWAALSVVCFHIFFEVFGVRFPEFRNFFISGIINGALDVRIFFLVSGMALAYPYFLSQDKNYVKNMYIKRYFRLAFPIAIAILTLFVIDRAGMLRGNEAAKLVFREDWPTLATHTNVSGNCYISYVLYEVFSPLPGCARLLPQLWTMPIELAGSFLIYMILGYLSSIEYYRQGRRKFLKPLVILLAVLFSLKFFGKDIILFIAGFALTLDLFRNNRVGRLIGSINIVHFWIAIGGIYLLSCVTAINSFSGAWVLETICAVWIVLLSVHYPPTKRFLEMRFSLFLGRISYPMYLLHSLVIMSFTSRLIIAFQEKLTGWTSLYIGLVSLALAVLLAWLFVPVDRASFRFSVLAKKSISDLILIVMQRLRIVSGR